MDAILDTSVIIEVFKGNSKVVKSLPSEWVYGLSAITVFELYCGTLKEKEELMIEKLPKLHFDEKSAKIAGEIYRDLKKKGNLPPAKDLLIAANAIAHDKMLVTCDKDFELFTEYGLKVKIIKKD